MDIASANKPPRTIFILSQHKRCDSTKEEANVILFYCCRMTEAHISPGSGEEASVTASRMHGFLIYVLAFFSIMFELADELINGKLVGAFSVRCLTKIFCRVIEI